MSSQTVFGNPENIMMSRTSSMLYSNESLCKWRSVGRCCKNPSFVTENKSKKRSTQIWNKCINLGHYVLRPETMLRILLIITILFRSDGFLTPKDFSDYLTLQSFNYQRTDRNYSRNVSCTLNSIFTFILFANGSVVSSKNFKNFVIKWFFFSLGYYIITLSCGDDDTFVSCNNSITHVVSHKGFFVFVFFGINNTNQIASHKIYFFLAAILKSLNK